MASNKIIRLAFVKLCPVKSGNLKQSTIDFSVQDSFMAITRSKVCHLLDISVEELMWGCWLIALPGTF